METQVKKLIQGIEFGFMAQVVTGNTKDLTCFRETLINVLTAQSYAIDQVDLSGDAEMIDRIEGDSPILLIWGLEQLSPMQSATYALRSHLDIGQHAGFKFVIFCEEASYSQHFNDYEAPFYHFCTRYQVS